MNLLHLIKSIGNAFRVVDLIYQPRTPKPRERMLSRVRAKRLADTEARKASESLRFEWIGYCVNGWIVLVSMIDWSKVKKVA